MQNGTQRRTRWPLALLLVVATLAIGCRGDGGDEGYAEAMQREHAEDIAQPSPAAGRAPAGPIETEDVVYANVDGQEITGFLARPEGAGPGTPGVLVIQEWWGLNDNIRSMAEQLAGEGYIALAVDLYRGEVAADRDRAYELMSAALERMDSNRENLRQAHAFLTEQAGAGSTGSVGWCFGGGMSLQAALALPGQLDATVIYYGQVEHEEEVLRQLETPILGLFAGEDQGIPLDLVHEFERVLKELEKPATVQVYPGVGHAFANPTGTNYDAAAAEDAWARTLGFFETHLKGGLEDEPGDPEPAGSDSASTDSAPPRSSP